MTKVLKCVANQFFLSFLKFVKQTFKGNIRDVMTSLLSHLYSNKRKTVGTSGNMICDI